ncbi:hypothetical protein CC80DRAFT_549220 [Byssothecium circinans]|uniref:Uncharacterized protein n=1 Tax=Byssothecium circinans TaxID=147558 RepID=A0A6A5TV73_9PLEO|nr:hypothetical protein CC80DRAFT_549220 [Byssothecium circinans]
MAVIIGSKFCKLRTLCLCGVALRGYGRVFHMDLDGEAYGELCLGGEAPEEPDFGEEAHQELDLDEEQEFRGETTDYERPIYFGEHQSEAQRWHH